MRPRDVPGMTGAGSGAMVGSGLGESVGGALVDGDGAVPVGDAEVGSGSGDPVQPASRRVTAEMTRSRRRSCDID